MHILFQRKHLHFSQILIARLTVIRTFPLPPLFFSPTEIMLEATQLLNGEISTVFPDSDSPALTPSL